MEKLGRRNRWWLFGAPALICLPCILPAPAAGFLAVGGGGAFGSFVSGVAGPVVAIGALLIAASGVVCLTRRR